MAWLGLLASLGLLAAAAMTWAGGAPAGVRDAGSLAELGPAGGPQPASGRADALVAPSLGWPPPRRLPRVRRTRSALPSALPQRRVRVPGALHVPALGLRTRVMPIGLRGRSRELALPADARTVAWYRYGAHPGAPGVAVIAAHADYDGRPGAFAGLATMEPGQRLRVGFRRGGEREFRVIARRSYDKRRLPRRLFATSGPAALALVTCGGRFDRETRTYERNTVIWAVAA